MKEYFDDFMKSAKRVADVIVVKTAETVDAAKLEIEIRKVQNALDREYKAFGQIMFQVEKGALKKDESIIKTACKRIQNQIDELESLLERKADAKKDTVSEEKETEADESGDDVLDDEEEADQEAVPMPERGEEGYFVLKFCPKCKIGNHPDAVKCVNCGEEFKK